MGRRMGVVLTEALERKLVKARGGEVDPFPLGLSPGRVETVHDGHRACTMSCAVDLETFEALAEHLPDLKDNTLIYEAATELLRDLNYRIVEAPA